MREIIEKRGFEKMIEKVSVLMTIYNGAEKIALSISHILNQSYKNLELVIVNDGSSDNSADIVNDFMRKDNRIIFINREENKGRQYSLNEGLQACKTNYIVINDADDVSHYDRIEKQMYYWSQISNKNEVGIVGTDSFYIDELTNSNYVYRVKKGAFFKKTIPMWRLYIGMPFIHSSFIYNKKALDYIGGFPTEVSSAIDYFALIKIATAGYKIYNVPDVLVDRYIDGNNFFLKKEILDKKPQNSIYIEKWKREHIKYSFIYSKIKTIKKMIKLLERRKSGK